MSHTKNSKPDDRLSTHELTTIRSSIEKLGAREVAERLSVTRLAISNALAGLPIRKGTVALIRLNWENLKK